MKLFVKNDVVVCAFPDSHPDDTTGEYTVHTVPDGTPTAKEVQVDGMTIPTMMTYTEVLASVAALPYGAKRAAEYPPITDYLDGVVKGDQAQIDAYIAACQAVKTKYPKPE